MTHDILQLALRIIQLLLQILCLAVRMESGDYRGVMGASTNLFGQIREVIRHCFLLCGMLSRDGLSRLHHKAKMGQDISARLMYTTFGDDPRLAYALVHLDILAPRNRVQLLRRQLENLLLSLLACDLCIDDGE